MRTLQPNIPFTELAVGADFATPAFITQHMTFQSYQIKITGDLVGTAKLQTTNDVDDDASWTDVTSAELNMDASSAQYGTIENFDACSPYYRMYFEYTSGTGDAQIIMFGKGNS